MDEQKLTEQMSQYSEECILFGETERRSDGKKVSKEYQFRVFTTHQQATYQVAVRIDCIWFMGDSWVNILSTVANDVNPTQMRYNTHSSHKNTDARAKPFFPEAPHLLNNNDAFDSLISLWVSFVLLRSSLANAMLFVRVR